MTSDVSSVSSFDGRKRKKGVHLKQCANKRIGGGEKENKNNIIEDMGILVDVAEEAVDR